MSLPSFFPMIVSNQEVDKTQSREGLFLVERRENPRISVELPFDYSIIEEKEAYRGMVADASEGGLLIHLLEKIEIETLLKIEILFSNNKELTTIHAIAKVVWSDLASDESWAKHRYGLQFLSFFKGDLQKLKILLKEVGKTHGRSSQPLT